MSRDFTPEQFEEVLRLASAEPAIRRASKSLIDQFIYRFASHPDPGAIYAVVQFSEQLVFQMIGMNRVMYERLKQLRASGGERLEGPGLHECFLQRERHTPLVMDMASSCDPG